MNFDLDDPLGDILSDGSDDSFFESKKNKSTVAAVQVQTTALKTPSEKSRMEDLFGIGETLQSPKKISEAPTIAKVTTPIIVTRTPPAPAARTPQNSKENPTVSRVNTKSSVFGDDDLMSELGFDPKRPKSSKSNILDDLLAPVETSNLKNVQFPAQRPTTSGGLASKRGDPLKVISRQSTDTTESTITATYSSSVLPKTAATGRRSPVNDPLEALLGGASMSSKNTSSSEIKTVKQTPKTAARRIGTTADWLGLSTDEEPKTGIEQKPDVNQPKANIFTTSGQAAFTPQAVVSQVQQPPPSNPAISNIGQAAMLMATSNLENQSALQVVQQQEAQVILATQMKNQEAALLGMQQRQQELLTQQEAQFNDLLQKQLTRHSQLEGVIRSQQERISAHIQLLMTQAPPASNFNLDNLNAPTANSFQKIGSKNDEERENNIEDQIEEIQLKAEVKRLELEKLRLEDLLSHITGNHEKEIEYMESSHRKQLQVLEENSAVIETRLKNDEKKLEEFYTNKLKCVESEKCEAIQSLETKLKNMQEEYTTLIRQLKADHDEALQSQKSDHRAMIENIRQSKLLEFAIVQDNSSYLQTLKSASSNLETATDELQTLRDSIHSQIDEIYKEKERALAAKEKKIEDTERRLKISEETSKQEHGRLLELVTSLEIQLEKLSKESSEEQWNFRQKLASLDVERASFERERKFIRDQLEREEKHLKDLKNFQLEEYQKHLQTVQVERQQLSEEKAKLETAKQLQSSSSLEKSSKGEIESSLKIAKDATRQADQERERYLVLQRQLEGRRRELIDHENTLRTKQDELEAAICSARAKERFVQETLQRTREAERNFTVKVQFLQHQMRQIGERESKLAEDTLLLSQERIELQKMKQKLDQNKCSLCRIGERNNIRDEPLAGASSFPRIQGELNFFREDDDVNSNVAMASKSIDSMLDQEVLESLKKMELLTSNFRGFDDHFEPKARTDIFDENQQYVPINDSI